MKPHKLVLVVLCVIMLCGCAAVGEYVDIVRPVALSKDYLNALDTWTRGKTVYSEFETRVKILATWKNRDFNDAYWSEYSKLYDLTTDERQKRQNVSVSDMTEFLFYAYTPDRDANTFSERGSIWKIYLVDERGNRHEPREVRQIDAVTPLIMKFYPYVKPAYGKAYILKFAPDLMTGKADEALVFTSVLARVELTW